MYYTGSAYIQFLFMRQPLFKYDHGRLSDQVSELIVVQSEEILYVQGICVIKGIVHVKHQSRYFNFLSLGAQIILSHHSLITLSSHTLLIQSSSISCSVCSYQEQSTIGAIRQVLECWRFYRACKEVTKISWYF